jgi:hypothetical protein
LNPFDGYIYQLVVADAPLPRLTRLLPLREKLGATTVNGKIVLAL